MRKMIEATGNTRAEAEEELDRKREAILNKNEDATFGAVREYGNFELGYKLVQEYSA